MNSLKSQIGHLVSQFDAAAIDGHNVATTCSAAEQACSAEKSCHESFRNYVSTILQKLHLHSRTQAALYALKEAWAMLDSE